MYYQVTQRSENVVEFDVARIADAIRKAFEATETDYVFEDGYEDGFCRAGYGPAVKNNGVCEADNFFAEDRLTLKSIKSKYSRRAVQPRGRKSGGHLIFPILNPIAERLFLFKPI